MLIFIEAETPSEGGALIPAYFLSFPRLRRLFKRSRMSPCCFSGNFYGLNIGHTGLQMTSALVLLSFQPA